MFLKKWTLTGIFAVLILALSACSNASVDQTTQASTASETVTTTETSSEANTVAASDASDTEATTEYEPYYFDDFTLYTLDGEETSLYAYEGKIILLNFWATWCPYCVNEMPLLDALDKRDDVVVLAVDVGEDQDTVNKYLEDSGYGFQVFLDETGDLAGMFGVTGLPMTVFMGPDFEYYYVQRGMLDQETLDSVMNAIDGL